MDPKPVRQIDTEANYGALPRAGLPVQVQCDGFKCMAFLNTQGRWIDFFTREPLVRVFGVIRADMQSGAISRSAAEVKSGAADRRRTG